jgi:ABC-type uncharacterized transport system permease subunit
MKLNNYSIVALILSLLSGAIFAAISVFVCRFYDFDQFSQILAGVAFGFLGMFIIVMIFHILVEKYYGDELDKLDKKVKFNG